MICDIIMNLLKKFPNEFKYKHLSYGLVKHIMKVVDETENLIDIENSISISNSAEDLIMLLHGEVTFLKIMLGIVYIILKQKMTTGKEAANWMITILTYW